MAFMHHTVLRHEAVSLLAASPGKLILKAAGGAELVLFRSPEEAAGACVPSGRVRMMRKGS